jgi:hypothetical protein
MDSSRKTKIGIHRKHTSFLRQSDIGQFVTCDEPHFTRQRHGGSGSKLSSLFQYDWRVAINSAHNQQSKPSVGIMQQGKT